MTQVSYAMISYSVEYKDRMMMLVQKIATEKKTQATSLVEVENGEYRKVSNIRRTKSQNLNASRLIL